MLNKVKSKSSSKISGNGKEKNQLKESSYLKMMRDPLSVKRWAIQWDADEDFSKGKKTIERSFKTKLPPRKIITLHFKGTMSCLVKPEKSTLPKKQASKGIEYKIWINGENKIAWAETQAAVQVGTDGISHSIDKSISLIIPKSGNTNLSISIENVHGTTSKAKTTTLRIDKGFTIRVTKITSF